MYVPFLCSGTYRMYTCWMMNEDGYMRNLLPKFPPFIKQTNHKSEKKDPHKKEITQTRTRTGNLQDREVVQQSRHPGGAGFDEILWGL